MEVIEVFICPKTTPSSRKNTVKFENCFVDDLESNIRRVVGNLQPRMINRSIMDIKVRAQMCLNAGGGHFELNW